MLISVVIAGAMGEIGVRILGSHDNHGNFVVRDIYIKPYRLPVGNLDRQIKRYISEGPIAVHYDPVLGWSPKPNSTSEDGIYLLNSVGLRSAPTEYPLSPRDGTLRIAIFGDSFVMGDEVPFEQSWGYYLEIYLKAAGIEAEVLNFGVGGYGMDQAFLRWKELGSKYSPQIVIFGFQPENVRRNVNLYRNFLSFKNEAIFTKPRFILDDDSLELINVPTVPPERMVDLVAHFGD